jgi:hypothetical protein
MSNSRVLFENRDYVICLIKQGLTVQNKSRGKGKCLASTSPQFEEWLAAFETTIDEVESLALAREFYLSN